MRFSIFWVSAFGLVLLGWGVSGCAVGANSADEVGDGLPADVSSESIQQEEATEPWTFALTEELIRSSQKNAAPSQIGRVGQSLRAASPSDVIEPNPQPWKGSPCGGGQNGSANCSEADKK